MSPLDKKIRRFCAEYALSPQQTRVFEALMGGALSDEALRRRLVMRRRTLNTHLGRIAQKTMTRSRTELLYLFLLDQRGQ